jgi:diamine N-acetyltransferase
VIRGTKIELRAIEREDLPRYVAWFNDSDVMRYFGRYEPMSLAQEEDWYETQLKRSDARNFAVYYQGEHIGVAGYFNIDGRVRKAEVGLVIGRKDMWNLGLGTDILATLLRFGFEQMNLHRIYLQVYSENIHAIRCYEKVGFKHEGRLREAEFRHNRYHDMLLMSVLNQEYSARSHPATGF